MPMSFHLICKETDKIQTVLTVTNHRLIFTFFLCGTNGITLYHGNSLMSGPYSVDSVVLEYRQRRIGSRVRLETVHR